MNKRLMTQRQYESALKDLIEEMAHKLDWYEPNWVSENYLPSNIEGVNPIRVVDWLVVREAKRGQRTG